MKDEAIKFLRYIGEAVTPDGVTASPECEGQGADEDSCPDHKNCGICRFEYMKRHGWLSQQLSLEV